MADQHRRTPPREAGGGPDQKTAAPGSPRQTKTTDAPNKPASSFVESDLSTAERAVLELVRQAARDGAPAPTSDDIAIVAQVESLSTPTAILRRLQLRGEIYVESYQRGRRIWLPDGRSTAPPQCTTPPWRWRERREAAQ